MQKTLKALKWIVEILDRHEVPYRIGGGFAAHTYGAVRPINDIDITFPGKYFSIIIPEVADYVTYQFGHSKDEKWDCNGLMLEYGGQEIDMTDIDTLKMSNKEKTEWLQTKDNFRKYPNIVTEMEGVRISLIDPRDLAAYKKHLDGDHQIVDINAVEEYIKKNNIH
jgi:hypothetical protein